MRKVFFRADGHAKMGLGHVIRSLALVEMLKEVYECHFLIRNPLPTLKQQISEVCEHIIVLPETNDNLQEAIVIAQTYLTGNEIVVLDGYHFVTDYQQTIKATGCKLVCIDDIHAYHFIADVVINHAGGLSIQDYSSADYTQFFLGLKYALLRKPFRDTAQNRVYPNREENALFICLGGADPNNDTLKVLKNIEQLQSIKKCYLVLGGAYQHRATLKTFLTTSQLEIELLSNLSAEEMVHYMKKCGQAITSPSTISYEYSSVGGVLYLKTIADNQVDIHHFFMTEGLAFDISQIRQTNTLEKKNILTLQQEKFDGKQQKRFKSLFKFLELEIRRATRQDMLMYLDWANEAATRAQSFNSSVILLENHQKWFYRKIEDDKCVMYVVLLENQPIGQIRFDCSEVATISYSLDKNYRGQGLGIGLLRKGVAQYRVEFGSERKIIGFVKKSNLPSVKAFQAIGFEEEEAKEYEDSYKYTLS